MFRPLFIHQYPDWTKFRYNAQSVLDALGQTRLVEGKLIGIVDILSNSGAETEMLAQDISASFALDGYTLGTQDIDAEIKKKNAGSDVVRNFVGALQNAKQPLTTDRLFAWHASIGQNKVKKFRTKENSIGNFSGVSPDRIPLEIERFINWFENSTQDGALKAAIAHFWFLTIRPFDDGNGRIARILSAMLLARSENTSRCEYALNAQILKCRDEYLEKLFKAQSGNGDITEWILWFLKALRESIEAREKDIAAAIQKMKFSQRIQHVNLSEREHRIIEAVWSGALPQKFSVKEAATLTGTSHDSALRDIQSMIAKGIVRAESKGGRSQKYSLV